MALAACGGGGGDPSTPSSTTPPVATPPVTAPVVTTPPVTTPPVTTPPSTTPTVSALALSPSVPKYSDELLITVEGSNLDQGLVVTAAGCKGLVRSTQAPRASSATTSYYTCTVSTVGANSIEAAASAGSTALKSAAYNVALPRVTLTLSDGGAVNGDMVLELDPTKSPITVDNFLAYVQAGFYVGTIFHRIVPGFVVQGGGFLPLNGGRVPVAKPTRAPIALEVGSGLSNLRWTVAMARTDQADSATSQFFINLVDNPALNPSATTAGYAVFGNVVAGTSVIQALTGVACAAPITNFSSCPPSADVLITAASRSQ